MMIVHQIIIGRLFKVMLRNIQISLEHIGIIQILAFTVIQINVLYFMEMQSCSVGWREMMH